MDRPLNYDFGKNWASKIAPLLSHPDVQLATANGLLTYEEGMSDDDWSWNGSCCRSVPAAYAVSEFYTDIVDFKEKAYIQQLRDQNLSPSDFLALADVQDPTPDQCEELRERTVELAETASAWIYNISRVGPRVEARLCRSSCSARIAWNRTCCKEVATPGIPRSD